MNLLEPKDLLIARIFSKEETGLYYYGARYLDPKYSRWLSGDLPAPDSIPGIPDAKIAKRKTPVQNGELEKYNKRGIHQGVVDPNTGEQIEPPKNDRKVEP